jgi:hypothetical protein
VFKKRPNFCYKDFIVQYFKHFPLQSSPSTGDTPFPVFLTLLECFLERTFCDGVQFSYRVFLNLRVFKRRPNFLNSAPTIIEGALRLLSAPSARFWQQTAICPISLWALVVELHPLNWAHAQAFRRIQIAVNCQNLPLGALSSRSAPSVLVGALFKMFGLFLNTQRFRKMRQENCAPSQKMRSRKHSNNGRNVGNGVSPVEGLLWRGQCLKCCKIKSL